MAPHRARVAACAACWYSARGHACGWPDGFPARVAKRFAAALGLCAIAACAVAPDTEALVEMHTRAIALYAPMHRYPRQTDNPRPEAHRSDLQSSRDDAAATPNPGDAAGPE
jgi:hypothetical protein